VATVSLANLEGKGAAVDWQNLIQSLGLPAALLFMVLAALWKVSVWAGTNLIKPLCDKHIQFLDQTISSIDRIATNQERCAELQAQVASLLGQHSALLDQLIRQLGPIRPDAIMTLPNAIRPIP